MIDEIKEKNLHYQNEVRDIAKMIFHAFYFDEQESLCYPPESKQSEKDCLDTLLAKAEKIYRFFPSAEEAKKSLKFLHEISPIKGLEIMNSI